MVSTENIELGDGRNLRFHDSTHGRPAEAFTLVWHHGSPQTGAPLAPLLSAASERGIRLISYGRPSYGGSSPNPDRSVGSAAADVERILDTLGIEQFAAMGASGGGPHALACAALLPERVSGAVSVAGLAPISAESLDWFAGMTSNGAALRAAVLGRAARERFAETEEFDPDMFTPADWDALAQPWKSLGEDAGTASTNGAGGLIDDDLAYVAPWGFEPGTITAPVLLAHGGADRIVPAAHSRWLLEHLAQGELWLRPRDGHVSIMNAIPLAMDWLSINR